MHLHHENSKKNKFSLAQSNTNVIFIQSIKSTQLYLQVTMKSASFILALLVGDVIVTSARWMAFKPDNSETGEQFCAINTPIRVILISALKTGVPEDVPMEVLCSVKCLRTFNCISYNYWLPSSNTTDDERCELFTSVPDKCILSNETGDRCFHHLVRGLTLDNDRLSVD